MHFKTKKLGHTHHYSTGGTSRFVYNFSFRDKQLFHKETITNLCSLPCVKNWTFSDVVKKGRPTKRVHSVKENSMQRVHKPYLQKVANSQVEGSKIVQKNCKNFGKSLVHINTCNNSCTVTSVPFVKCRSVHGAPNNTFFSRNRFEVLHNVDNCDVGNDNVDQNVIMAKNLLPKTKNL